MRAGCVLVLHAGEVREKRKDPTAVTHRTTLRCSFLYKLKKCEREKSLFAKNLNIWRA